MDAVHLAEKLWDMANLITGFAVAQVLATTFAFVKGDLKVITGAFRHRIALLGTFVFTGFYVFAIVWCGREGYALSREQPGVWCHATEGRVLAVGLFTVILLLTLRGHRRDEIRTKTPKFLALADTQSTTCQRLASQSKRTGVLLIKHKNTQTGLLACLDDLLGSVYNLFYATHLEYADRLKPLSEHDIGNVSIRANDMGQCKIRIDGKWAAGVFFNNALFRLAAVYHRVLKIAVGKPASRDYPHTLLPAVEKLFQAAMNTDWEHTNTQAIYKEVTDLKHTADGIFEGRSVQFVQAIDAVDEILTLVEALC